MRILLVHPDDCPERGPWSADRWDRIVDLGKGGSQTYERWSRQLQCPATSLGTLSMEELRPIRNILAAGTGRLLDREGLDWWELTSLFLHQQLEVLAQLRRFADHLQRTDEVFVTRPDFQSAAMEELSGKSVHAYTVRASPGKRIQHYGRLLARLSAAQLREIFWDKYDPGYSVRGALTRRRKVSLEDVILLPSAYVNVSRTATAYAKVLPHARFLLVTTRRSALLPEIPSNVVAAPLACYASRDLHRDAEHRELLGEWLSLRNDLERIPEISLLRRLGCFDSLSQKLRQGLAVRDAWSAVFDREPVKAVLCCDDSNPYTLIPLLLGRNRGVPVMSSHHGAFDGRHLFKRNHADLILAKGRMEADYLVQRCRVPAPQVEIGAPGEPTPVSGAAAERQPCIVFFSEAYEVSGGRAEEFYRDILPPLAEVARRTGRRLVIKLHPFESPRDRRRLVRRILSLDQRKLVKIIAGPLTDDLLEKTWFGMTVLSTVTMDCALRGIPCFLAAWLEHWPYGYIEQFNKFGAGHLLRSAGEISAIPEMMERNILRSGVARDLWQPISASRLERLISAQKELVSAVAV